MKSTPGKWTAPKYSKDEIISALYEALKNLVDIFNSDRSVTYLDCDKAEKALAKVEK